MHQKNRKVCAACASRLLRRGWAMRKETHVFMADRIVEVKPDLAKVFKGFGEPADTLSVALL